MVRVRRLRLLVDPGDVSWEDYIRALNSVNYQRPLSVDWEMRAWTGSSEFRMPGDS